MGWCMTVARVAGVLPVGDAHAEAVRVDDGDHQERRGVGPQEHRVHSHLHHAVQGEVRHQDDDAGRSTKTVHGARQIMYSCSLTTFCSQDVQAESEMSLLCCLVNPLSAMKPRRNTVPHRIHVASFTGNTPLARHKADLPFSTREKFPYTFLIRLVLCFSTSASGTSRRSRTAVC